MIPGCGDRLLYRLNNEKSVRPKPIQTANTCELPSMTNPSMELSNQVYCDGLNIYTQYGDLQPLQLFTLFYEFRMLPEYSSCSFLPSLDSVLLRMQAVPDETKTPGIKQSEDVCKLIDDEVEVKEGDIEEKEDDEIEEKSDK